MDTFRLTFRPEDIEEIYDIPADRVKLKSIAFYTLPAVGLLSVLSSFYWFMDEKAGNKIFFGIAALVYGLYLLSQFRKKYMRIKMKMDSVRVFVDKNAKFNVFTLEVTDVAVTLKLDEEISVYPFTTFKQSVVANDYLLLDFEEGNLLLPEKSFRQGEFEKLLVLVNKYAPQDTSAEEPAEPAN